MLLIASSDARQRALLNLVAYAAGSTVVSASTLVDAVAHLERETITVRYERREAIERCSITAAVVMLGFDDGDELCRRIEARGEAIPLLWLVAPEDSARAQLLARRRRHRCVHIDSPDATMVRAWLAFVRPLRIACEARRRGADTWLEPHHVELLIARARHAGHVSLLQLARDLGMPESTLRSRCEVIGYRAGVHLHRLAAQLVRHIGDR